MRLLSRSDEILRRVRDRTLYLHCPQVEIAQFEKDGGIHLLGYGVMHCHKSGFLYFDFICTTPSHDLHPGRYFPQDPTDKESLLQIRGRTIDGASFSAGGVVLPPRGIASGEIASRFEIVVSEVRFANPQRLGAAGSYLYAEFSEPIDLPTNKWEDLQGNDGSRGFAWNETNLVLDGFSVSIRREEGYHSVRIVGSAERQTEVLEAVLFYLAFTSGRLPQPYYLLRSSGDDQSWSLMSRDHQVSSLSIPPPTGTPVTLEDGRSNIEPHIDFGLSIVGDALRGGIRFRSSNQNWARIFAAINTSEREISFLCLGVSIEGILNDVYATSLSESGKSSEFEMEKERVKSAVLALDSIEKKHKDRLVNHVGSWGTLSPKKMLSQLEHSGLLSREETKAWEKIRHPSVHPRFALPSVERERETRKQVHLCLGLFYKLVLRAFNYSGAIWDFSQGDQGGFVMMPRSVES